VLVYRSVWSDDDLTPDMFFKATEEWLRSRGSFVKPEPNKRVQVADDHLDTWLVESDHGRVARVQKTNRRSETGEDWRTIATLLMSEDGTDIWVEVVADLEDISQREISAPGIVKKLLLRGSSPRIGNDSLEAQPQEIRDSNSTIETHEWLDSDDRRLPAVVFAGTPSKPEKVVQRATVTSETLAGLVRVIIVEFSQVKLLNKLLPETLHLAPGDVRLVLPGALENPDDPRFGCYFMKEEIEDDVTRAGQAISRHLGLASQWPDIPGAWQLFRKDILPLASIPSEDLVEQRSHTENEVARLRADLAAAKSDLLNIKSRLEEKEEENSRLTDQVVGLLVAPHGTSTDARGRKPLRKSIAQTISEARNSCNYLEIP